MGNIFVDFVPIILFFLAYKNAGIIAATKVLIATSIIQVIGTYIIKKKVEKIQLISTALLLIFGSFTLYQNNEMFLKWKPTVVYWIFSISLIISQVFTSKSLIQRAAEKMVVLDKSRWNRLNIMWAFFFLLMGLTNIYVVYNFDTNTWVNFKLFGTLGLTVLFVVIQSLYMFKYAQLQDGKLSND